jgi:hypothetical protein
MKIAIAQETTRKDKFILREDLLSFNRDQLTFHQVSTKEEMA